MRSIWAVLSVVCLVSLARAGQPGANEVSMFNGRDLSGWSGDERVWRVEDGMIVGQTTADVTVKHNEYLFWEGSASNFHLTFAYRIVGGNSGMQYRSRRVGEWDVAGYQADIEDGPTYSGALYESAGRGVMALRGQHLRFTSDGKETLGSHGDAEALREKINDQDWNKYEIIADGPHITHKINGQVMVEIVDDDPSRARGSGLFCLQVHAGPPMLVQFRDLKLKDLGGEPFENKVSRENPPHWLWSSNQPKDNEIAYFRKSIDLPGKPVSARLFASGDNHFKAFVNGRQIASGNNWERPTSARLRDPLQQGMNVLAIEARNDAGPAALAAILEIDLASGEKIRVVTDGTWTSANSALEGWNTAEFDDSSWTPPHSFGPVTGPDGPWRDVFSPRVATPVDAIQVPDGFEVDLLYSAQLGDGSWVSMTFDDRGRIVVSPQAGPLMVATLNESGSAVESLQQIELNVKAAQGMLFAYDSLYVTMTAPPAKGGGLHRIRDTDGDGIYDQDEFLSQFGHTSEHGAHGLVLGPDGMIYTIHGNYTGLPEGVSPDSPFRDYDEDLLLPRLWDPRGHAVGIMSPAARVLRTDPDATSWEIVTGGMRNPYDIAFNPEGELFAYDADMEWDIGAPWYRAPRVVHTVSGGEFGWRGGTGKWPPYYMDSLPAVHDTDLSSPTGMAFGTHSAFPKKYREALFIGDWAYGRILATHLTPDGASYKGTYEEFATGKPLNVTDFEFGPDGAMYFITGGRGTQSGLYRVRYVGETSDNEADHDDATGQEARTLRRSLEKWHGKADPRALDEVWPHLNSDDRWIRFAARVAVEHQDPSQVWERAKQERRPWARLEALMAVAKDGDERIRSELVLDHLGSIDFAHINTEQELGLLRIYMIAFARAGGPTDLERQRVVAKLDGHFPADSYEMNRELSRLLTYLRAPRVAQRTLALLAAEPDPQRQLHYALMLRFVVDQLNEPAQFEYFAWLERATSLEGGLSLGGFVKAMKREAMERLTPERQEAIAQALINLPAEQVEQIERKTAFVKAWTMQDLVGSLDQIGSGRSFEQGRVMFSAAQCIDCHRIASTGGATAPDLTGASGRFSRRDLLENVIEPSKVISDQYEIVLVTRNDGGEALAGWVVEQNDDKIVINTEARVTSLKEVPRSAVERIDPVPISLMPTGLLHVLTKDEIMDLLAYIESGGDPSADNFK